MNMTLTASSENFMYYNSTTNKKEYFARTKKNKMPGEYHKKLLLDARPTNDVHLRNIYIYIYRVIIRNWVNFQFI